MIDLNRISLHLLEAISKDEIDSLVGHIVAFIGSKLNIKAIITGSTAMMYDSEKAIHTGYLITPKDLDIDWTDSKADISRITDIITRSVQEVFPDSIVVPSPYNSRTRGIVYEVLNHRRKIITKIDIRVKNPDKFYVTIEVKTKSGQIAITYGPDKIIADKIHSISNAKNRMWKDTVKLYAYLLNHDNVKFDSIVACLEHERNELGKFLVFFSGKSNFIRFYPKHKEGVKITQNPEPSPETVYEVISVFIKPFQVYEGGRMGANERKCLVWSNSSKKWIKQKKKKNESLYLLDESTETVLKISIKERKDKI